MSISSEIRRAGPFAGNGATVAFPFTFKVFTTAQVVVTRTVSGADTTLTLTTDYTVTLNSDQDTSPGGTVTMLTAPATGQSITITSNVANLQPTVLANLGGFYPEVINDSLDRATIQIQQLDERLDRALVIPVSSSGVTTQLPVPESGKLIGWNSGATGLGNYTATTVLPPNAAAIDALTYTAGDIIEATGASTFRARKFQTATYATLRALSGLSVGDAVYVNGRAALRDGGEGWGTVAAAGSDNDGITIAMADSKAWIRNDIQESVDADAFGIVPGTLTVADYNTMVSNINLQNTRTVGLRGGVYVFPSRPSTMTTVMRLEGAGESITTLERGYSEGGGATVGFLEWNDNGANNSKLSGMLVRAGSGTTGGTMIRFYVTTTSALSWPDIENVVVSPESGAYAYAMDVDGILNTTAGSQGIRSLNIHRSQFFGGGGAGTDAIRLRNVVNCHLSDVWTNGNVLIGGGGSSSTNSNRVTVTGFEAVGGTLTIENCDGVFVSGTMNNATINATAANVVLIGDVNDLTIAAGATGSFTGRVRGTLTDNSGGTFGIYTQTGPRGATAYNGLIELARATVNMNITTDQAVTVRIPPGFTRYALQTGFVANNGSANYSTAAGGIYLSASKTTPVVDAAQVYTSITAANKRQTLTINSTGLDLSTDTTLFFSLTTAAGVAGTGDLVLVGYVFT